MCNCKCNGASSSKGPKGDKGNTGANGADGINGHVSIDYSYPSPLLEDATAYVDHSYFLFKGSSHFGMSPTSIKVVAGLLGAYSIGAGKIEIYDVTNSVVIGVSGNITSHPMSIVDIPITGAIPAGEAIWSVRMKMTVNDDTNTVRCWSLNIDF